MAGLRLSVLGPFRLERSNGKRVERLGSKGKALLAYLAAQPDGCADREALARLLWDESCETEARHSLRQALMTLRQRLGDEAGMVLRTDRDSVELCLKVSDIDVRRFEEAVESQDETRLLEVCRLWRGPFCEGLDGGSEAFEEWLLMKRIRIEELAAASFKRVAEMQLSAGCFGSAVSAAHQCVALNPYDENSHAALIDLYRRLGWIGPARAAQRRCVALFRNELGVSPGRVIEEALIAPLERCHG